MLPKRSFVYNLKTLLLLAMTVVSGEILLHLERLRQLRFSVPMLASSKLRSGTTKTQNSSRRPMISPSFRRAPIRNEEYRYVKDESSTQVSTTNQPTLKILSKSLIICLNRSLLSASSTIAVSIFSTFLLKRLGPNTTAKLSTVIKFFDSFAATFFKYRNRYVRIALFPGGSRLKTLRRQYIFAS